MQASPVAAVQVKALQPTVFVYSLNPEIDLSVYKPITGESGHVVRMPNIGREGGVYLAHILAYWDKLAGQLQASVWNAQVP